MKVVLFCGGLGTRLREYSETIPKPMVNIGHRPMLWHLMKYYAYYGHMDFVLCLGYRGDLIRQFFLTYDECMSNDFELSRGGREVRLFGRDIQDWRITFADTGLHSNIGQRLKSVERYLDGEETFMANYSDGLSDLPLDEYASEFRRRDKVASFLSVRPSQSFHVVSAGDDGLVTDIRPVDRSTFRINGGFFIFKKSIFDYMRGRRRAGTGALSAPDREGPATGSREQRLLGRDGYVQGQAALRRYGGARQHPVGGLEDRTGSTRHQL